jgi:N,N'-diacetyllegionaminate synthase
MKPIFIESHRIQEGGSCFIIAEAGVNHNGDLVRAKKMVDVAKRIGANAIKFQSFKTEKLVTKGAKKASYQQKGFDEVYQFEMLKKLELSEIEFIELYNHCRDRDIIFLSTPFEYQSADFLNQIGVGAYKIGSGDLTDYPLLRHIGSWGKPMILSTGMSTLDEIEESIDTVRKAGCNDIILLHCTSSYPVENRDANILLISTLRESYNLPIGFSDHTLSTVIPASAVALGAVVIEKHFTLDNNLEGPDHKMSLMPNKFKEMVINIREVETALGDGVKRITQNENQIRKVARKSIVAAMDILEGTIIEEDMLEIKRPGTGLEPKYIDDLIGLKSKRDIPRDNVIKWSDLE